MDAIAPKLRAIAARALKDWDSNHDSRVGKTLTALSNPTYAEGYRADISELHKLCAAADSAIAAKDAEIEALRARVTELERAQTWRPIEEAPKDGTPILMRNLAHSDDPFVAFYCTPREYFEENGISYGHTAEFLDTPKWGTSAEGSVFSQFFEGRDLARDCTFIRIPAPETTP